MNLSGVKVEKIQIKEGTQEIAFFTVLVDKFGGGGASTYLFLIQADLTSENYFSLHLALVQITTYQMKL